MIIKFYPDEKTMISILKKELPYKVDFDSGTLDNLKAMWDLYQKISKQYSDKKERQKHLKEQIVLTIIDNELGK